MPKEDSHIEKIKSEQEDYYSNDDIYNIKSWGADLSFRELIQLYDDEDLVKPELQRKYIWDKSEASRFIDSILLGLPVPSIFLAKQHDEKMLIIDGYQRLMTVRDYVKGIFSTDNKVFKLTRSEKINRRWRGKAFSELPDTEQRRIRNTTIHAIIFVQEHPSTNDTGMYQVFERINTSGRTLLTQEIRNCVYQGNLNTLLMELNKGETWRKLYGLEKEDSRMRDIEFILRFMALSNKDFRHVEATSISLKKYLNEFMGMEENNQVDSIDSLKDKFIEASETVYACFGVEAFHNISTKYPDKLVPKFNPTIYDSIMIATSLALTNGYSFSENIYKEKRLRLLRDETYQDAISIRTTNIDKINARFRLALQYLFEIDYEQL
jgi:uncharacterized protein with ParB-like and HNH nuclease domain